jgi:hypothetical protein
VGIGDVVVDRQTGEVGVIKDVFYDVYNDDQCTTWLVELVWLGKCRRIREPSLIGITDTIIVSLIARLSVPDEE